MRFSARALFLILVFFFGTSAAIPSFALAQNPSQSNIPTITPYPTVALYNNTYGNPYNIPNTDPNVPVNQHTRVQTLVIDLLSTTMCVLIGVDPGDTSKPCLNINPTTGKIGYSPSSFDENGNPKLGGILGAAPAMISILYVPTVSTSDYTNYVASNFGIVQPVYAQNDGYGFSGLNPIITLWSAIRNIAYFLLMAAFVIIGLGVMLRVKIDPRTVMTLQNQIPRIVVCILLVTFSYGIAGLLIDAMWLTTYAGINVMTGAAGNQVGSPTNPNIPGQKHNALDKGSPDDPNYNDGPLSQRATANLLQHPLGYVNQIFRTPAEGGNYTGQGNVDSGIGHITDEVSYSLGFILQEIIHEFVPVCDTGSSVVWATLLAPFTLGGSLLYCLLNAVIGWVATVLLWIIILFILFKSLFSVWFTLIKAYTFIILYTIGAPFFIVMGLLPGKSLGFEKWLRSMVANLAVFPLTVFLFVLARIFVDLYKTSDADGYFTAPLLGNPNIQGLLGWVMAFGIILMAPTLLTQLQESLKVPGNKYGGAAIGGALAAGAAAPKAITGGLLKRAWQKEDAHHNAGIARRWAIGAGPDTHKDKTGFSGRLLRGQAAVRSWMFQGNNKKHS